MFTEHFDNYVCEGETITCTKDGFEVEARIERDTDTGPPWDEYDGHGLVSDWRQLDSKLPGEKVLHQDRRSYRFYDWKKSIEIAKADSWDAPPYGEGTKGEQAVRAVQRDFESLKAWCNDEWWWGTIVLRVSRNGFEIEDHAACLGGVTVNHPHGENNHHLTEHANELLDEAIESAKKEAARICKALTE